MYQKVKHLHYCKKNCWNNQIVQMIHEEHDQNIHLSGNIFSRIPIPVELSHKWPLTNFEHQKPDLYVILFDESEEFPFRVPSGHNKVGVIIKPGPGAPQFYSYRISIMLVCSVHCSIHLLFW